MSTRRVFGELPQSDCSRSELSLCESHLLEERCSNVASGKESSVEFSARLGCAFRGLKFDEDAHGLMLGDRGMRRTLEDAALQHATESCALLSRLTLKLLVNLATTNHVQQ